MNMAAFVIAHWYQVSAPKGEFHRRTEDKKRTLLSVSAFPFYERHFYIWRYWHKCGRRIVPDGLRYKILLRLLQIQEQSYPNRSNETYMG